MGMGSHFLGTHVITLPCLWPSHYTENLIAKLSFAHFGFFSPPLRGDGSVVRKEAECKKFSLPEIYPRNCSEQREGGRRRRMSESGTKAVVWRVQMTLPAVRMALKQCGSGRNRCRAAERPTTALSLLFSFSWHCENIHPSRYRVPLLCLCAHKEHVKVGTKEIHPVR